VLGVISRVPLPVEHSDFVKVEGRHAFEASDVDTKLVGVRAAFVVRVDAAIRAEMVLGSLSVEAVGGELVLARSEPEISRR